jgi:hypothetical protein
MEIIFVCTYVFSLVGSGLLPCFVRSFIPCYLAEGWKLFYCIDNEAVSAMKHIFVMYVQKCMTGLFLWSAEPADLTDSLHIGKLNQYL